MSIEEYRDWKSYIDEKDKNQQGQQVGYYYWAVCNKCQAWTKTKEGKWGITMRDDFNYPFKPKDGNNKKRKHKVALVVAEQKQGPPAGEPAAEPALAPAPAPAAIEPPPQPGTAQGHWVVDPPPPPAVPAGREARWVACPAPAPAVHAGDLAS